MKKELLSKLFLALCVMMLSLSLASCGDDDETQNGWYAAIDTDQSSANFIANDYLQLAVKNKLSSLNNEFMQKQMNEKEAKTHFQALCTQISNEVNAMGLPVLDDSYCVLYLTHSISDANGTSPVITTQKITFTPSSN